jgi:hypothetical protein
VSQALGWFRSRHSFDKIPQQFGAKTISAELSWRLRIQCAGIGTPFISAGQRAGKPHGYHADGNNYVITVYIKSASIFDCFRVHEAGDAA